MNRNAKISKKCQCQIHQTYSMSISNEKVLKIFTSEAIIMAFVFFVVETKASKENEYKKKNRRMNLNSK